MDRVDEHTLAGDDGKGITLRVYSPPTLLPDPPGLVYFHGGGWVLGNLKSHDTLCSILASQTPCRVIAVDYRLAPESPFPAAVDDALAAFRWVVENADTLGIDRRRIAVGGDSAGGNLATAVCLEQARAGAEVPAGQLLIYPVTDTDLDTGSYGLFASGFGLSRATMGWFFEHYVGSNGDGDGDGSRDADPRLAPLRADDLSGLPPAIVATAGFDVLRDEGRAYADRLEEAGVEVVRRHYPGLIHGFANICLVEPCRQALDELINDLAYLFHRLESGRNADPP
jgi:acetyl esterase